MSVVLVRSKSAALRLLVVCVGACVLFACRVWYAGPPARPHIGPPNFDALDVLTQHNDTFRTGRAFETRLTPQVVQSGRFGKLYLLGVDGYPYAQPLYVHRLPMGALGVHEDAADWPSGA
jgi:hypothetical protein